MSNPKTIDDRMKQIVFLDNGCWEWQGYVAKKTGYGSICVRTSGKARTILIHRYFYTELVGEIEPGAQLDHTCHTEDPSCNAGTECLHRRCVNPAHLEPVTHRENVHRGRGFAGLNHKKTHCPEMHEYTEDNTYVEPNGGRQCIECRKTVQKRYYASAGGDKKRSYARERMRKLRADPAYKEYKNARERERYQRNKAKRLAA